MLRLIFITSPCKHISYVNFKTSYVTVNHGTNFPFSSLNLYFKTSYVTVNRGVVPFDNLTFRNFKTSYVTVNPDYKLLPR